MKLDDFDDDEKSPPDDVATAGYTESACTTHSVRCFGSCFYVLFGLVATAWVFHAFPVASIDAPAFARSLIWMSIAHHTDAWKQESSAQNSPPPPSFGDGYGNF
mgnify:CR=1 FL=1